MSVYILFLSKLGYIFTANYANPLIACTLSPALMNLGKACLTATQSYDGASGSMKDMVAAEVKFNDVFSSPTRDITSKKIDDLATKNQLNSFLPMMHTKAWSEAKESTMTKEEVRIELVCTILVPVLC